MKLLPLRIVRVRRNEHSPAEPHQRPRKRFRNHEPVPSVQNPGIFERNMKSHHGSARRPRQHHRTGLGDVLRSAWTVYSKCHCRASFNLPPHPEQTANGAVTARPSNLHEAKLANDSPGPFSVKAIAAHHPNLPLPPEVDCGKYAAMPEAKNHGPRFQAGWTTIFERYRCPQRRSDQANRENPEPGNQPQQESLPQRERLIGFG